MQFKQDTRRITDINELTPVDLVPSIGRFDQVYFKREDLYLPFHDMPLLGGGKVKQTISLFEDIEHILNRFNGVVTYVSVNSPQAVIVVKVSRVMGYDTHITIGVNDKLENIIKKHKPVSECVKLGAKVHNVAKIGYNNVLLAKTQELADAEKLYIVHFGINIDEAPESLTNTISTQVQNIPDELDAIVVPVGSGIQFAAIIAGIKKYKKKVGKIIGIQISGYDRSKTINNILMRLNADDMEYIQIVDKTYPYSYHVDAPIINENEPSKSFNMNVVYESKAWKYFINNKKDFGLTRKSKIMYWVVGNNNYLFGE